MNDIEIIETWCTKKQGLPSQKAITFKVKIGGTSQVFNMNLEVARKKYPQAVLDFLINRISIKKIQNPPRKSQQESSPEIQSDTPPKPKIEEDDQKIEAYLSNFKKVNLRPKRILNHDCILPLDTAIAYPVHFRLPYRSKMKKMKEKKNN